MTELLIIWIASVVLACVIGGNKEDGGAGFVLAFFFGPLGVLITLCLPNHRKLREEAESRLLAQRQIQLQQEEIRELRALRAQLAGSPAKQEIPPHPFSTPQPTKVVLEDFVPENMRGNQRWRR